MELALDATAKRLLHQLLNEKHDEDEGGDFPPVGLAPTYDYPFDDDPGSPDDWTGAWSRKDSLPWRSGLQPSPATSDSPLQSSPDPLLCAIAAHIASVERQIGKLQRQYEAAGPKMPGKVRRKRFLTSCSTSPKTDRKKRKVQETLSPGRCIGQDDPVCQNLNCVFFDIADEEDDDQQDSEDSDASPGFSGSSGRKGSEGPQQWGLPQAAPSVEDESRSTMACRAMDDEILDPSDPACLVLPSLLQYLTVADILQWRLTSSRASRPRVLVQHLSEMGSLDRSESILEFANAIRIICRSHYDVKLEEHGYDVEQVKYFECRWWCMFLASARMTHFAESDVVHIVGSNLRSLLGQCSCADFLLRDSAHLIILTYGRGGLPFVKRLIAEEMLRLMENLLPESAEISEEAFSQFMSCTKHVKQVLRALEKPQRQQWVSLLVRALQHGQKDCHKELMDYLELLWRADDDPGRSYAEAEKHLMAFSDSASYDIQLVVSDLLVC